MIEPKPDDELIRDLKNWGESQSSLTNYNARSILRREAEKQQSNTRMLLVLGACIAIAIASSTWFFDHKSRPSLPTQVAIETLPVVPDPEQLLQSIASRTQDIALRVEGLQARFTDLERSTKEFETIHSEILHFKRAAVRNQIALRQ